MGLARACRVLQLPRCSLYRLRGGSDRASATPARRPSPARRLSPQARDQVRAQLDSPRFADQAPRQVWARLLDEDTYLCSVRTMYRILAAHGEVRERRNQLRHPAYTKPELLATGPNQLWSWDVSQLRGPVAGIWYYLYVLLDVFSRYVVGWLMSVHQHQQLGVELIHTSCQRHRIPPQQLTVHADRGAIMQAQSLTALLINLGVTESHSRPRVCDDNPYSEAQFKTLKYHPTYPDRFGSLPDAQAWGRAFFAWYNHTHYHTGLGLLTPAAVHFGLAAQIQAQRQQVLDAAYAAHPERFVRHPPRVPTLPPQVWINRPALENPAANASVISSDQLSQTR